MNLNFLLWWLRGGLCGGGGFGFGGWGCGLGGGQGGFVDGVTFVDVVG